ncbi:MAG: DUF3488 and transglutaminase-like domain-containing protein [Desulfuromonadaceae bacterium]|nr:DUF3488 and transglutaminase-like domain-containing protein [Desulfuromonadaceae bacterium]MDD2856570.1 DUF3488 and transglutaminase-like domain-containing protein [Desulfuromonadaceae bacterium]
MVSIRSLATLLTYLIGLCGVLPLFPWLTLFPQAVFVAGILYGVWQERPGSCRLKPWMQNFAIVPIFLYYLLQYSHANPIQPVTSVISIVLALRLSGEKTIRHSLQIYTLSTFCLASSSLFDLSPIFLIYTTILLFLIAVALVLLTFQSQDGFMTVSKGDLKKILTSALLMPLLAIPLLLLFFPLLPRTQMPLWHFLTPPAARTTGYSESVEPGSQSSIAESHRLAFRAEMPHIAESQLYWRGKIFNRTDGNRWSRDEKIPSEQPLFRGGSIKQTIYPEPTQNRILIALDRPVNMEMQRTSKAQDGVFEIWRSTGRRISYSAISKGDGVVGVKNSVNRKFYLQLPEDLPERVKSLAVRVTRTGKSDSNRVELLSNYFRDGGYRYSMRDLPTGDRAIEGFIFKSKQGNCEFFASSFALLLRVAGVPCRLVGGYLGGEYNDIGGYYLVTDSTAYVWVEVFIDGLGWVRVDPSSFATNATEVWKKPETPGIRLRISLMLDSFNYLWNRSVVSYDFEQQLEIVNTVGSRLHGADFWRIFRALYLSAALAVLIFITLLLFKRTNFIKSREKRVLNSFLNIAEEKFNIRIEGRAYGLFEIEKLTENIHVSEFVEIFAASVYRDKRLTESEYQKLRVILKELKRIKAKKT